ncbi:hypothetical protein [Actinoplanes sp. NPDC049599]|uniref:hypothetical protein n=1 Tax=Actinoplanes sp. NPDC049599 TaxID=3363903 RepID=UPI0037BB69AE
MIDARHAGPARIVDTERRPLRPIGTTASEVARRTGELLTGLLRLPGVRLYQGVRLNGQPPLPYALSAGPRVVLVDAVAWPPGSYATSAAGAVFCGGVYIGQSAGPLLGAVRRLRRLQPRGHRASAVVVVHPSIAGRLDLPAATGSEVSWIPAGDAVTAIRCLLRSGGTRRTAPRIVEALTAASGGTPIA